MKEETKDWLSSIAIITVSVFVILFTFHYCDEQDVRVHDVTVKVYYLDGSTKVMRLTKIRTLYPRIICSYRVPYLEIGKGRYIPCIDRFDVLSEKEYTAKNKDL